ncbi:bifunctional nicotinamidase/pyrazinamidase [Candidatus Bathyarchaeota archaeon]|nr:bifunctional nicotinamidase/pyrazinamidase [Candidatus Bathyarchaeota archaeon]
MKEDVTIHESDALLVIDMQYDFLPGGALAVAGGDTIVSGINRLIAGFHDNILPVVFTQDWHPPNHASFASQHEGKQPHDPVDDPSGRIGPILWPDHCVQGTKGAEIHQAMALDKATAILRKGFRPSIDSYSAFLENDKRTPTGLQGMLKELKVQRVFTCGLALDYCVYNTAIDAIDAGFDVIYVIDLAKPVGAPEGIVERVLDEMCQKEVVFTRLDHVVV